MKVCSGCQCGYADDTTFYSKPVKTKEEMVADKLAETEEDEMLCEGCFREWASNLPVHILVGVIMEMQRNKGLNLTIPAMPSTLNPSPWKSTPTYGGQGTWIGGKTYPDGTKVTWSTGTGTDNPYQEYLEKIQEASNHTNPMKDHGPDSSFGAGFTATSFNAISNEDKLLQIQDFEKMFTARKSSVNAG